MRRRKRKDFDELINEATAQGIERAVEAGFDRDAAIEAASKALAQTLEDSAPAVADKLVRTSPRMLRWHRRQQRAFERRLRKHWGRALDLFFAVLVCAEEVGATFNTMHRPVAEEHEDLVFEAMTGLHARACRIALEVHRLLAGGFPMGALSRCRTLHELAVTMIVLAEHGRKSGHLDLAERFLLHSVVMSYQDALVYQENCQALGYEPFIPKDMEEMKRDRDELIERFGSSFKQQYGWASGIAGAQPSFRELEKVAELAHLRSHYRWASHEIHSDAKGWALNQYDRGGISYLATGAINTDLADPGHLALISLQQCTCFLLIYGSEEVSPHDTLALMAMQTLVDRAGEAFAAGQASVEAAEERFQARVANSHFRFRRG
jgi:hypothetical protein